MHDPNLDVGQKPESPGAGGAYYAEPPKKQRGCFFYGCLFTGIFAGVGLLLLVAAVGTGFYFVRQAINQYTDTVPQEIPVVNLEPEAAKDLDTRWDAFTKALKDGTEAEIVLTSDEVNALIEKEPKLKGQVFAKIEGEKLNAKISINLGALNFPGLGGRFINGDATFTAKMEDGDLDVRIVDGELKGKRMDDQAKAQFKSRNLADSFVTNPENRKLIRKIKSIQVKDSKVYLKTRAVPKEGESEADKDKGKDEAKEKPGSDDAAKPALEPEKKTDDVPKPKAEPEKKAEEAPAPKQAA